MDLDLTDYVEVGAKAYVENSTHYDWDRSTDLYKHAVREEVLPIVQAVLDAYVEAHPALDLDWLEG